MRPIERGAPPQDEQGNDVVFLHYSEARDPLIQRIGDFCSYCEVTMHNSVDVEHVLPKSRHADLERTWSNLLVACSYCNPTKSDKDVTLSDYFWPDTDNTARAFVYELDQPPQVAGDLTEEEKGIAQQTLELTGVDRAPGHRQLSPRDRRWRKRREVWGVALLERANLRDNDTPQQRASAIQVALSRGFWSVGMQVFYDDLDMRERLINAFPGTAHNCFDGETQCVPRPDGNL